MHKCNIIYVIKGIFSICGFGMVVDENNDLFTLHKVNRSYVGGRNEKVFDENICYGY